jgi:outer membrane protein assembly factor BamB
VASLVTGARSAGGIGSFLVLQLLVVLLACDDSTTATADPRVLWFRSDPSGAAGQPYADSDLAVFTSFNDMRVDAFDAHSGVRRWEVRLTLPAGAPYDGMPTIGNVIGFQDLLIVPAWDLYGIDRSTGAVRWQLHESDDLPGDGSIFVAGGKVYAVGQDLYSVDASTGAVDWRLNLDERPFHPIVIDSVIYVATRGEVFPGVLGNGHALALDAATGTTRWSVAIQDSATPVNGGSIGPAFVTDSLVLLAGVNGTVYALDRATGQVRWTYAANDSFEGGLVVLNRTVVVAGDRGLALGLDLGSGKLLWQANVVSSVFQPIASGDDVALVSAGILYAIDPSGQLRWQDGGAGNGQAVYSTGASYANGLVYIGSVSHDAGGPGFYAIRAQ